MRKLVLIVDDEKINRKLLTRILCDEYETLEAQSGEEALSILADRFEDISAILLDIIMPEMDGFEVLRRIRANKLWTPIPVIVVTAMADEDTQVRAITLGANGFVAKPYNPKLLRYCIGNNISLLETSRMVNILRRDSLTGLYNRETFFSEVKKLIATHEPGYYVLSCIDVDRFKVINDQYGTDAGDSVLRHIAECVSTCISKIGGLCCRFMADKFAVLYPFEVRNAHEITENHMAAMSPTCISHDIRIRIGRYIVSDLSLSVSAMYDRAILAAESIKGRYDIYIAKYDDSMRDKLLREQKIVNEMYTALAKKQFEIWFQPQYNHVTGALIGAEALVRWHHPVDGLLVPPGDFIPTFERNGFIYELDKYVWEQVCAMLQKWLRDGLNPLPVSVNISRHDVFQADFFSIITGLVHQYDIPIELLRLEITESAFAESTKTIVHTVNKLIKYGFTVEIDDFGSGYSSLNTLKDVPASILKLDMKFLEDTSDANRGGSILESVVRMARWLGMAVIAEGVETIQQADYLKSISCDYVQGYLYSKAIPAPDYEKLCKVAAKEPKVSHLKTIDTWNNSAFWDPKSMETLIFNSYIGGACVFEYHGGRTELLRYNDKYFQIFSGHFGNDYTSVHNDLLLRLDSSNKAIMLNNINNAIDSKRENTCELCLVDANGHSMYLSLTVRLIARAVDRYLFYCVVSDITAQHEMVQKERETAQKLNAVMDHIGNGIIAVVLRGEEAELLLANDKYFEIIGCARENYCVKTASDILSIIHPDDRAAVRSTVIEINKTGNGATIEYRVLRPDGTVIWVSSVMTITSLVGIDAPVQVAVFSDITAEKESSEQLRFLNASAHDILAQSDSSHAINDTLQKLMDYFAGDRAYVIEFDYVKSVSNNTYEVCAEGVTYEIDNLQSLPFNISSSWFVLLQKNEYVVIESVAAIDDREAELRELLSAQNISSLIITPLWRDGRLIGYTGIDNPTKAINQLSGLRALGDYIAILLTRRDLNRKIQHDNEAMQIMINDTPGGFCQMELHAHKNPTIVSINDGFCQMLGMTKAEVMAHYGDDVYKCLSADDTPISSAAATKASQSNGQFTIKCHMLQKNGEKRSAMAFARFVTADTGERYINSYFTDITAQMRAEDQQRELLDNLPFGTALYEYDGQKLSTIHINKRYTELVNRGAEEIATNSVVDSIHPDDRSNIFTELSDAIAHNRDAACDMRLLYGKNEYRTFHVDAKISAQGNGKYMLYVTYSRISEHELTFRETLPFIFSTIMESSTDLAFAKDRNFRYLCCSKTFAELLGLESEDYVVGKTDYELFSKDIADLFRLDDSNLIATAKPQIDVVEQLPSQDGQLHYVKTSKHLLRNTAGEIIGIYGVGRDVTESRETYAQLKLMTDSIPGGLATYICAPGSIRISYFNNGLCELFGTTREDYEKTSANDPIAYVFEEDRKILTDQYHALMHNGTPIDCIYRIHVKGDSSYKWVHHRAVIADRRNDTVFVNAALFDITERQESNEQLRVSEEENRIALEHSGSIITKFDVKNRTLTLPKSFNSVFVLPPMLNNVPEEQIALGLISPETADAYTELFESILAGSASGTATYQQNSTKGWRWLEAQYTTVFSNTNQPVSAVISLADITEQLEKEVVYNKWQQSLNERPDDSYSLFRCNLSRGASYDSREGSLLTVKFDDKKHSFNARTQEYVEQCVYRDDRDKYLEFMNSDTLLADYYRGHRSGILEYRERCPDGSVRWLRLSVDLVEYPNSKDIEVYLMYENIDEQKKADLLTLERSETDPLTGVLNRATFISRLEHTLEISKPGDKHALFMLDVDEFKHINDTLGHGAGDKVLQTLTEKIRAILRHDDLIGRLGGDEFFVFLKNISDDTAAASKAGQICSLEIHAPDSNEKVTASVGIAMIPRDGNDFDTLYKKVDNALYCEKRSGKAGYLFVPDSDGKST